MVGLGDAAASILRWLVVDVVVVCSVVGARLLVLPGARAPPYANMLSSPLRK